MIVKRFHEDKKNRLHIEKSILEFLNKKKVDNVTQLQGISDDETALILSPVGKPFSRGVYFQVDHELPTGDHFCELIKILEKVHKHGVIHRDIKLENFFLNPVIFLFYFLIKYKIN